MKRNRVTSVFQVISIIACIPIALINLILYFIARQKGSEEIILLFLFTFIICIFLITVSITMNIIFSNFGNRRIIINKGSIIYMNKEYKINEEYRLIYSKVSLQTILAYGCPGDLILIVDNKEIKLGWYFGFEIKKMKKFIPIKPESQKNL